MSKAIVCDRCGKLVEESAGSVTVKLDTVEVVLQDVCTKCMAAITKYAKNGFKMERSRKVQEEFSPQEADNDETPTG